MAALAAVVASVLAILANLENSGDYIGQGARTSRPVELYLDAAREAEYLGGAAAVVGFSAWKVTLNVAWSSVPLRGGSGIASFGAR